MLTYAALSGRSCYDPNPGGRTFDTYGEAMDASRMTAEAAADDHMGLAVWETPEGRYYVEDCTKMGHLPPPESKHVADLNSGLIVQWAGRRLVWSRRN